MKFSEAWLREWVNPKLSRDALCEVFTMSGLEVEEATPVASEFSGVVVGEILSRDKHPDADKLSLCEVSLGGKKRLNIVCGATNVAPGMRVPVATIGATLPNGLNIKPAKIRGVASAGMMCTASELGLADESEGLMALAGDATLGADVRDYLNLNDYAIDLAITPNRGDCLGMKGVAREIATLTNTRVKPHKINKVKAAMKDKLAVTIKTQVGCPRYVGRVIRHVDAAVQTPIWLKERLRRSGLRSINAIVDITNYVMLELGQPMHAFDLTKIDKKIIVRHAKQGEALTLLDGSEQKLVPDTMLIADNEKPLAIAGVMGGIDSGVTTSTTDIFLESAFFAAKTIAFSRQTYQLNSDSAYRFERGVDPELQHSAIERATALILEIAGGEAGPVVEANSKKHLPKARTLTLHKEKVAGLLGVIVPDKKIVSILKSLGFACKAKKGGWQVKVPTFRSDITMAVDLIEEIARVYGYDKIPVTPLHGELSHDSLLYGNEIGGSVKQKLCAAGYHEVITYSFVHHQRQELLNPGVLAKPVLNPITAEMDVMRTNMWPGLIETMIYNKSRQQQLVRLFEVGTCFHPGDGELAQPSKVAGLLSGPAKPEQWGEADRAADFFDLKGDLSSLFSGLGVKSGVTYQPGQHKALHPKQTAYIFLSGEKVGTIGKLHPSLRQKLDLTDDVYLFELDIDALEHQPRQKLVEVSKFPEIRRDIAIIVSDAVPIMAIQGTIIDSAGCWLKDVFVFDVYQGKGIAPGCKSVAIGLILQDPSRTLVDEEVAALMDRVVTALKGQFGAELRS